MSTAGEEDLFHYPISDELDLHTFHPSEVKELVTDYLYECQKEGIYRIRVIHGKGKSVLKHIVHKLLEKHPLVLQFHDAPARSGSWGATIVHIREK